MKCIMTFMAGTDAVLVSDMVDHHLLQGVDAFLIADFGASIDVSRTLRQYSDQGFVYLLPDCGPDMDELEAAELLVQQAFTSHGATCVLTAHAGDFWLAGDRSRTVREVLEHRQCSVRHAPVPVSDTETSLPDVRFEPRIRWNPATCDGTSADESSNAPRLEVFHKPNTREPETGWNRILHQLSKARLQRSVDLVDETESLRAELQRMQARKVVRVTDRVARSLKNARARQRTLVARVSTLPQTALSLARAERVQREALRPNTLRLREVNRLLKQGLPQATENGIAGPAALPVVMCLWNRPQRIDTMLESFARQATKRNLRVILWNNAPQDANYYRERVREFHRNGALASIELLSNPINIGGMARFVVARTLWEQGHRGPVIMVDDDQNLSDTFVEDSLAGYEAHSINAWWAFRNHGSHWSRSALEPGDTADYGGTGGAAVDVAIVEDRSFFKIPVRYFMLEDQWMSHYAHARGWTIHKSSAQITAVLEETNQYHAVRELKDEFFTFLHR
ncbi:hypothetical protein [Cryobacterium lyxosi]|uniref:Uncharacterized protein n=1 Tax=Cryobacterium lyxosi TaxID=1259228 RepID=A0A4R8ZIW5_9MICO|nr:hypothetical protein [Cryobacterium lyxosi]TFD29220.1 hypothetical protein E3T27_00365 [Cryobacterium lyxosi]